MKLKSIYKSITNHEHSLWIYLGVITFIYVVLMSNKYFLLWPLAGHDDGLQLRLAQGLTSGEWLGAYNSLTLAKGLTYPVWTALLHVLDIPLWLGNALLYCFACLSFVFAVRYIIPKKWVLAVIYALILFNPMITPRAYRDSISPALSLFVIAWIIGMFLIFTQYKANKSKIDTDSRDITIFTTIGIFSLPAWWFLREDYFWLLPFLLGGIAVIIGHALIRSIKLKKGFKQPVKTSVLLFLPFLSVLLVGGIISSLNKHYYGRFVVNDFTSVEFRDAYGALTRIKDDNWHITVPVSGEMREQAYKVSPAFNELKICLDNNGKGACEGFKFGRDKSIDDYEGGWFFWAFRQAVESSGYYQNPTKAEAYYKRLAAEINTACDTGKIDCPHGKRSSLTPVLDSRSIKPIIESIPTATGYLSTLNGAKNNLNYYNPETYSPDREGMSNYINARYDIAELNFGARAKRKILVNIAKIYSIINPILLLISVLVLIVGTIGIKHKYKKYWREILIGWGITLLIVGRIVMLAYVDTTSFPAISTIYFSSSYPLMLALEGLTIGLAISVIAKKRSK